MAKSSEVSEDCNFSKDIKIKRVGFKRQLNLLLWKCILVKKRQKIWLFLELFLPCLLFVILSLTRLNNFMAHSEQCHFDSKALPSAGVLPFMHSFFCSFSNRCHQTPTTGDETDVLVYDKNIKRRKKNESILVDAISGGAEFLLNIGRMYDYDQRFKETLDLVNFLNKIENLDAFVKIEEILSQKGINILKESMKNATVSKNTIDKLFQHSLGPGVLAINKSAKEKFPNNSIFCNETIFKTMFNTEKNQEYLLSDDELNDLCNKFDLTGKHFDLVKNTVLVHGHLPNKKNSNLYKYLETMYIVLKPLIDFWEEYSSKNDLGKALFCGQEVDDVVNEFVDLSEKREHLTVGEKLKEGIAKFIQNVSSNRENLEICEPIQSEPFDRCEMKNSIPSFFQSALNGYILVTPDNNITRTLVDILSEGLKSADYFRKVFDNYPLIADEIQNRMSRSNLLGAATKMAGILRKFEKMKYETVDLKKADFLEMLFAPSTVPTSVGQQLKKIIIEFNKISHCFRLDRFRFVKNEEILEKNAMCLIEKNQYLSSIVLQDAKEELKNLITYKIRHNPLYSEKTKYAKDNFKLKAFARNRTIKDLQYITFGFVMLQESIDRALLKLKDIDFNVGNIAQQEPFPCVKFDKFDASKFLPFLFIISFIFPSSLLVKNIVHEKEMKIKEQMRSMGLGDTVHFVSWAIVSLVINFSSIIIISVLIKVARILENTDFTLVVFLLLFFITSSIAMSIFISTCFNNANVGTAATPVLWILLFMPFQLNINAEMPLIINQFSLIFPPTAMGFALNILSIENSMRSSSWSNFPHLVDDGGLSLNLCVIMLIVDTVLCIVLAWYISAIFPGEYGVAQPFYFPFKYRYWFPLKIQYNNFQTKVSHTGRTIRTDDFELEPNNLKMAVHIADMSKVYDSGTVALDSLNLRLYENQITGLLGHNGAGKTTTMSILSGFYEPSSGTAKIYTRDIRTDIKSVREVLGICPQHNIFFTHLTVAEQLKLFAALKGVADSDLDQQVHEILESVSLTEKADELAHTLSGGMKRRLCIGIAFIGGSKFVILDEPTAGVDVTARKEIWKLLQKNKKGRTILLSTHHMDEADVLSDRIAILSHGKCITSGSPMFLKRRFGKEMTLSIAKNKSGNNYDSEIKTILQIGTEIDVKLNKETEEEIIFLIPNNADNLKLEKFFRLFDSKVKEFNLGQYGVSAPSMQNIFVDLAPQRLFKVPSVKPWWNKIFSKKDKNLLLKKVESSDQLERGNLLKIETKVEINLEDLKKPNLVKGAQLLFQHCIALISCRFSYRVRNKRIFLFQIFIPLVLVFLCELYVKLQTQPSFDPIPKELPLTTQLFGMNTDFYLNIWGKGAESDLVVKSMIDSVGLGIRCVEPTLSFIKKDIKHLFEETNGGNVKFHPKQGLTKEAVESPSCVRKRYSNSLNFSLSKKEYNAPVNCTCKDCVYSCSEKNWDWKSTPYIVLNSTDRLHDLSGKNLSQFRLITANTQFNEDTKHKFLGGFSTNHLNRRVKPPHQIRKSMNAYKLLIKSNENLAILGANMSFSNISYPNHITSNFSKSLVFETALHTLLIRLDVQDNIKTWFNNKFYHALPITLNILSNAIYRRKYKTEDPNKIGILTINHPMNESVVRTIMKVNTLYAESLALFRITCLLMVLSIVSAGFTVYLVEDRVCEAYHMQLVSGLSKSIYWLTCFAFDLLIYIIFSCMILLIFYGFGVKEFTHDLSTFLAFFTLFLIFGVCSILYGYALQHFYSVPALAFVVIATLTWFVGVTCTITVVIFEEIMRKNQSFSTVVSVCSFVFRIIPQYSLGIAVFRGSVLYQSKKLGENFLKNINRKDLLDEIPLPSLFEAEIIGSHLISLSIHCLLAALFVIILEMQQLPFCRKKEIIQTEELIRQDYILDKKKKYIEDSDVKRERKRVKNMEYSKMSKERKTKSELIVIGLAKAYKRNKLAVKGLTFAVDRGECFGLLGLNGAGKSTTFAMLTAKLWPGAGRIIMSGDVITPEKRASKLALSDVGYCPQFDALNMKLTTIQNLRLFARIRGICSHQIEEVIERLLVALMLQPYANTQTSSLSGGNRRKLSVAVALISQPSLVFLDEPSAGMDPGSQQFLWKLIEKLCKLGKSVVLTSHSMEECEALCTRIAIMDQGKIRCLGGIQHLKNKFGQGTVLVVRLFNEKSVKEVSEYVTLKIRGARLEEVHCTSLFFFIELNSSPIYVTLEVMNQLMKKGNIADYSLNQSGLDNVFQTIAFKNRN